MATDTIAEQDLDAEQAALDAGVDMDGVDAALAELENEGVDEMPTGDARVGLFDREIDDPELEAALDRREKAKAQRKAAQATFKERHDVVKGKLDALDLADGAVVRCGSHRVEVKRIAARSVSFETSPSRRLQIKLIEED